MSDWIWLNGEVLPMSEARIGVEDRGYQFADGVYEVIRVYNGRTYTVREHLERLERSAKGILINMPLSIDELTRHIDALLDRNQVREGMIYLQLTRGCSPRNHVFPKQCPPTLLFYTRELPPPTDPGTAPGAKLHSVVDERWQRCWIKSIALLPNILAKNAAIAAGADEAVFIHDGIVTECSASNFYAVIGGQVITHPVGPKVLPGITRLVLSQVAREVGVEMIERPLSESEAMSADEIFITSTTRELSWVSHWNGRPVGSGACGPVTRRLHEAYRQHVIAGTR